ncbi:hypothetical protein BDW66DRAFT_129448 [Aspergillus desertorum]
MKRRCLSLSFLLKIPLFCLKQHEASGIIIHLNFILTQGFLTCQSLYYSPEIADQRDDARLSEELDRRIALWIKKEFEETFGFAGQKLEKHVVNFLEFEYNRGREGAWETYTANLLRSYLT